VVLYRISDALTAAIISLMVIFGPWAFGTTQNWSIWTMNTAGYALGALWILKRITAYLQGYRLPWWGLVRSDESSGNKRWLGIAHAVCSFTGALGLLTGALLLYCFTSAINARATFNPETGSFEYHNCSRFLPHSFDSKSTWFAFWTYLGLACSFWSIRDWLLGKSPQEQLEAYKANAPLGGVFLSRCEPWAFPARLGSVLTLVTFNGGLLAAEGIIQRLVDSPRLLFVVRPQIHQTAITQFASYAYRANAAEYLNLLWPMCLGFWWTTCRTAGHQQRLRHLLLVCIGLMAAASIMSASRGGAFVCIGMLLVSATFLLMAGTLNRASAQYDSMSLAAENHPPGALHWLARGRKTSLVLFLLCVPVLGLAPGWKELKPRMTDISESIEQRARIYEVARQMARDFGVFGSGPGTYESVSELYRPPTLGFWPAQVHNDWLETRITFGLPGVILILSSLAVVLLRWTSAGGLFAGTAFVFLSWLALAGCLVHACFDFPFQVHSVVFLFLLICAILFTVSRRPWVS
jgi:hypothetical protein